MKKTIEILPPSMPNYFRFKSSDGSRSYGFDPESGTDITTLNREEAVAFANMMREEFLKHWEKRKKIKP